MYEHENILKIYLYYVEKNKLTIHVDGEKF